MLWLKIIVGYCLFAGIVLLLAYRSRSTWPAGESDDEAATRH